MWEAFLDALSLSVTALIMAFAVLIIIMLAMSASAAVFSRKAEPEATPAAPSVPVIHASDADAQHVAAIVAALEAAEVEIPAGGRVRIEKVSRRN